MIKIAFSFFLFLTCALAHPFAWADFEQDLSATGNMNNLQALRELHTRAVAGDADAQLNMGGIFLKGQDVELDYAEGAKWFRLAALQGNAQAQFNLGMMYATGMGTMQNHSEAVQWYRLAADQGLALAQLNLGAAYVTGQGVTPNEIEATRWTRLAADQGEAQAQFNLGVMYTNGHGVEQSYSEALRWARLAAGQGHETARTLAQNLAGRITPVQPGSNLADIPQQTDSAGGYYLQLAAFKSQEEADSYVAKMRAKLGDIDKPVSIFTRDGWIRTQLGPYLSLHDARSSAANLKIQLGYQPLLKRH